MSGIQTIPKGALDLTDRDRLICNCIHTFNQLRDFKLTAIEVLEWRDSLNRIWPDMNPDRLAFVIDKLMTGELEYKPSIGIQNLFKGLKKVERIEGGYRIKEGEKIKANWE